jgi:hypothetical protein
VAAVLIQGAERFGEVGPSCPWIRLGKDRQQRLGDEWVVLLGPSKHCRGSHVQVRHGSSCFSKQWGARAGRRQAAMLSIAMVSKGRH